MNTLSYRENSETFYNLEYKDSTSLAASNFDGSRKTYFAFHGWTSNGLTDFIVNAKTGIVKTSKHVKTFQKCRK